MERRQREAGLPPLHPPEPRPDRLDADPAAEVAERAARSARRSCERRRSTRPSVGRARMALVAGSLLAMAGLSAGMWLGADDAGTAAEPAPEPARAPAPSTGVEIPEAPEVSPAPADRAPEVGSGAS